MPKKPRDRVLLLDQEPDKLFKALQRQGDIPESFESFDQLQTLFTELVEGGASEKEAREALGVTYRNFDGAPLLQMNVSSTGQKRGLNKRAVRTDINAGFREYMNNSGKANELQEYTDKVKTDWNKLSRFEAQQAGREIGKQNHRGHVNAAMGGGNSGLSNMWPEDGARNVMHGSDPRIPIEVMRENNIPTNDLEAYYYDILEKEGLGTPRIDNALMKGGDEYMVQPIKKQPKSKKTHLAPGDIGHDTGAGVNPNRILAIQQNIMEQEAQGVSRQATENWLRNQTAELSIGDATAQSGPVKVVKGKDAQVVPPKGAMNGKYKERPRRVPTAPKPKATPPRVKAFPNRLIGKAGKALNVPMVGGVIAAGSALAGGAGPAAAAGAFVDAENPIDGGALADGTLQGALTRDQVRQIEKENKIKNNEFNRNLSNALSNLTPLGAVKNLANWALNGFGR